MDCVTAKIGPGGGNEKKKKKKYKKNFGSINPEFPSGNTMLI